MTTLIIRKGSAYSRLSQNCGGGFVMQNSSNFTTQPVVKKTSPGRPSITVALNCAESGRCETRRTRAVVTLRLHRPLGDTSADSAFEPTALGALERATGSKSQKCTGAPTLVFLADQVLVTAGDSQRLFGRSRECLVQHASLTSSDGRVISVLIEIEFEARYERGPAAAAAGNFLGLV